MPDRGLRHCLYCWAPIERRASGRPTRICGSALCRRAADAERHRVRRRRAAGLLNVTRRVAEPVKRGGRDPLIRRLAKQLAHELWPAIEPTHEEVDALVVAMRHGFETPWKVRGAIRKPPRPQLPLPVWETLEGLSKRAVSIQEAEENRRAREIYADVGLEIDTTTGAWVRRR